MVSQSLACVCEAGKCSVRAMGAKGTNAWARIGCYLHETRLLGSIQSTLYWDQNTRMPAASAPGEESSSPSWPSVHQRRVPRITPLWSQKLAPTGRPKRAMAC